MPTFSTPGPVTAVVEVAGAQVRVNASDRTDTVVLVEPLDATSQNDLRVAEKTTVDFSGGTLTVKTRTAGAKTGSVAITIDLPTGSDLAPSLAYSSVQVDGSIGHCEVSLGSGRIQLDRVAGLRASLAAGELAVDHVAGRADIEGGSAGVRIGAVEGGVKLTGSSGHVWIGDTAGPVDLTNSTGGVDIDRAGGDVTAMTGGRAVIRIGRMTSGHAYLTNASGNIEVGIGEGSAVRLERAETTFGSVRNSVPSQAEAGPVVTVDARTRRGDIIVQPAPQEASVASTS